MGENLKHLQQMHANPAREGCMPGAKPSDGPRKTASSIPTKQAAKGPMPTGLPKGQSGGIAGSKK